MDTVNKMEGELIKSKKKVNKIILTLTFFVDIFIINGHVVS